MKGISPGGISDGGNISRCVFGEGIFPGGVSSGGVSFSGGVPLEVISFRVDPNLDVDLRSIVHFPQHCMADTHFAIYRHSLGGDTVAALSDTAFYTIYVFFHRIHRSHQRRCC